MTGQVKPTATELATGVAIVHAIGEAIRDLGLVPSGHLYARVMDKLSLAEYEKVIGLLKRANLVSEQAHLLTWVGPKAEEK